MPSRPAVFPLAYAIAGGLVFVGSLLYFVASYVWRFDAPPAAAGLVLPIGVDVTLFTAFALHHSAFARTGVKAWLHQVLPPGLERATYVWVASVLFIVTCAAWVPVPGRLWRAEGGLRLALLAAQGGAVLFTLIAARRLGVLHLAGLTQVLAPRGEPARAGPPELDSTGPYRIVRHPIYLGWVLMVWLTPAMTGTRLVFAIISCAYLAVAVPFEERDLRATFGAAYEAYCRRVKWRMVPFLY